MPSRPTPIKISTLKADPAFRNFPLRGIAVGALNLSNINKNSKLAGEEVVQNKNTKKETVSEEDGVKSRKARNTKPKGPVRSLLAHYDFPVITFLLKVAGGSRFSIIHTLAEPDAAKGTYIEPTTTSSIIPPESLSTKQKNISDDKNSEADSGEGSMKTDSQLEISVTRTNDRQISESEDEKFSKVEHYSLNYSRNFIRAQISFFKKVFSVLIIVFVLQVSLTTAVLLRNPGGSQDASEVPEEATETLVGLSGEGEPGIRILQDFTVNKGVVDVGFNVAVDKRAISTRQHTNCKTPVPPPDENGCGFTLIPSSLGLPLRAVHYQRLYFDVESAGKARLKVDVKNYESDTLVQDLGVWENSDSKPYITLPSRLQNADGLSVRFWTDGGDIVIKQIKIEYLTVDHLKQTTLKLGAAQAAKIDSNSIGIIYEDKNRDRLLTLGQDQPWTCRADFPGVKPVQVDENGSVILLRDDSCYVENKPDFWYTDDEFGAMQPGDWILVFPAENIAFPFLIERSSAKVSLELTETSPL